MPFITVRVEFRAEQDPGDPAYTYYEPVKVSREATDLPEAACEVIAESAFQTDFYQVEVLQAVATAFGGKSTTLKR